MSVPQRKSGGRGWLIDIVVGFVAGGLLAAIVAVNLVIFSGIEDGYEASIGEVFEQNWVVGTFAILILIGGPIAGIVVARRLRRSRTRSS